MEKPCHDQQFECFLVQDKTEGDKIFGVHLQVYGKTDRQREREREADGLGFSLYPCRFRIIVVHTELEKKKVAGEN